MGTIVELKMAFEMLECKEPLLMRQNVEVIFADAHRSEKNKA